jgi:hypothetical protein
LKRAGGAALACLQAAGRSAATDPFLLATVL